MTLGFLFARPLRMFFAWQWCGSGGRMSLKDSIQDLVDTTSVAATRKFRKELTMPIETAMLIERGKIAKELRDNGFHAFADHILNGGHW